jgi:thiamine phosphate synthase YjbQ (UPF0047 family)
VKNGIVNLFLNGLSGSISVNENADYTVRTDMQGAVDRMAKASGLKEENEVQHCRVSFT